MMASSLSLALLTAFWWQQSEAFVAVEYHRFNQYRSLGRLASATAPTTVSTTRWANFSYLDHWYPVSWLCDLRPNQLTPVSVFDVPFVIAVNDTNSLNTKDIRLTALVDQCPHKAALLSEGRIQPETGWVQCAYHGWSFDGTDGSCQEIPQSRLGYPANSAPRDTSSARAVPAVIHQGMIWLWPGSLYSDTSYPSSLPPTVPELDDPRYTVTRVVRDFPHVDWTLLVSNILDPDHGIFAHQMPGFDFYSASMEHPMTVQESFAVSPSRSTGWRMVGTVAAVTKLLHKDQQRRNEKRLGRSEPPPKIVPQSTKPDPPPLIATSIFDAPTTISLSRRQPPNSTTITDDDSNNLGESNFLTAFWVCPTGTGKSRFMSAAISKAPSTLTPRMQWLFRRVSQSFPRWLFHLNLNNFLDQDTVLVASQQPHVLTAEAMGYKRTEPRRSNLESGNVLKGSGALFSYSSPTDRSVRLVDAFWDATASSAPNRATVLHELWQSGQLRHVPPRRVILDRAVQNLDICPDSQDAVRNCRRWRNAALVLATCLTSALVTSAPTALAPIHAVIQSQRKVSMALTMSLWLVAIVLDKIRQGFYFCYPASKRDRDLLKIPAQTWTDFVPSAHVPPPRRP